MPSSKELIEKDLETEQIKNFIAYQKKNEIKRIEFDDTVNQVINNIKLVSNDYSDVPYKECF